MLVESCFANEEITVINPFIIFFQFKRALFFFGNSRFVFYSGLAVIDLREINFEAF